MLTRFRPAVLRLSRFLVTTPSNRATVNMVAPTGLFSNRYKLEDMPDLTGKVAIVAGGSRGIGEAVTSALVQKGCEGEPATPRGVITSVLTDALPSVHVVSATKEHQDEAVEHISKETPDAPRLIKNHQLDLHSLSTISKYLPTLASLPRIDMLFLIAGIGVAPFQLTEDGIGNHYAVNNLSQMMLVDGLLDKMKETAKGKQGEEKWTTRIVSESSELHRAAPGDAKFASLDEMSKGSEDMDPTKLYGRSKLGKWVARSQHLNPLQSDPDHLTITYRADRVCSALFIRELAKHHLPPLTSDTPILAISVHPGAVATEQQQGATEAYGTIPGKLLEALRS